MAQMVCASCGQQFSARPQSPKQMYCSEPACQRVRRRRWTQAKLDADPDYRDNQLAAQRAWHGRNPDYWKDYRSRRKNQDPLAAQSAAFATSDASSCGVDVQAGMCWMEILAPGPDGQLHAWRAELTLKRPSGVCKDGRVQTEDSLAMRTGRA